VSDGRLFPCYPLVGRLRLQGRRSWSDEERSPIELGSRSSRSCPSTAKAGANGGETIALSSTPSSGSCAPVRPGATSRRDTVPGRDLLLKSFNRWRRDGTWDRLLTHAQTKNDALGEVEWEVSVDEHGDPSSSQHAAGARSEPSAERTKKGALKPQRRGFGTQQGRLFYQDPPRLLRWQRPPALSGVLTPGQRHSRARNLRNCLQAVRVPRPQRAPQAGLASGLLLTC
jgi:hypothetical protein